MHWECVGLCDCLNCCPVRAPNTQWCRSRQFVDAADTHAWLRERERERDISVYSKYFRVVNFYWRTDGDEAGEGMISCLAITAVLLICGPICGLAHCWSHRWKIVDAICSTTCTLCSKCMWRSWKSGLYSIPCIRSVFRSYGSLFGVFRYFRSCTWPQPQPLLV